MQLRITNVAEVDQHLVTLADAADRTCRWLNEHQGDSLTLLKSLKFEPIGLHPFGGHALNVIEQINQTFTYVVALQAARQLFLLHPDCGPLLLAPGAHASLPLDIMSQAEGLIGAETFAAVTPKNNGKLAKDLAKVADRPERHRYAFFASPRFPETQRQPQFERAGVQVWSLAI